MSYLVLARKYRPSSFDEVVGQAHITDLLKNSISSSHLAQAYLFCGPRGIGKTSCARILAKSLNCSQGPTIKPCNACPACEEITKGNSFDVLEIDGASNRGIDEIRTLRENVKFAPASGRYKIYIVDEVHMLTTEAFNALLKTLEEPPAHVKFIFATTAPNKVPATIISRCQRLDFRRLDIKTTVAMLKEIAQKEKMKVEEDALFAIAKASQGSMRDALSIFDQLSALSNKDVKTHDVYLMLGMVETEYLFELAEALSQRNCSAALEVLNTIIEKGKDIKQLTIDLIEHFRNLMIIKIGGKSLGRLIDYPVAVKDLLLKQAEGFSLAEILEAIQTFIQCQDTARTVESERIPLEVSLAKLTIQTSPTQKKTAPSENLNPAPPKRTESFPNRMTALPALETLESQKGTVDISDIRPSTELNEPVSLEGALNIEKIKKVWDTVTYAVSREKMSVATFLQDGTPYELKGAKLTVNFNKEFVFQKESLEHKENVILVERVLKDKFKQDLFIEYRIMDDFKKEERDEPFIRSALDTFGGKVVSEWHNDS